MPIHRVNSVGIVDTVTSAGIHIQMDPVLCRLSFWDTLKKQPRPGAIRIHHCCQVIAVLLGDVVGIGELIPGSKAGRRWLQ